MSATAQQLFKDFIRTGGGIIINKALIRAFGLELSVFMADIVNRDDYFEKTSKNYDGWFFSTKELRSAELGISEDTLKRLMSVAVKKKLVETEMRGNPAKQWIRVNYKSVYKALKSFSQCRSSQASQCRSSQASQCRSSQAPYNNTNSNKEEDKSSSTSRQKPVATNKVKKENPKSAVGTAQLIKGFPKDFQNDRTFQQAFHNYVCYKKEETKKAVTTRAVTAMHNLIIKDKLTINEVATQFDKAVAGQWQGANLDGIRNPKFASSSRKQSIGYGHVPKENKYKPDMVIDNRDL